MDQMNNQQPMNNGSSSSAGISTALGILSLVISIVGGITFGVIGAGIALVLGIVAIVTGINAKKQTNGTKGSAGFVCGILGLVFAVIFAAGCSICGAIESSATTTSYTCYGLIGGGCKADDDLDDLSDSLDDLQDELEDYYN